MNHSDKPKSLSSMKSLNNIIDHTTKSAISLLRDRTRTRQLLESAMRTLSRKPGALNVNGLTGKMHAASRMVSLSIRREYPSLPWRSLVLITVGFIYFVTPVDAIPDFIPLLGFTDDAAILTAIFASISNDLDKFIEWERSQESEAVTIVDTGAEDINK